jgi:hypothetical protein
MDFVACFWNKTKLPPVLLVLQFAHDAYFQMSY